MTSLYNRRHSLAVEYVRERLQYILSDQPPIITKFIEKLEADRA
jgi:hypothetical protein